jgi:RHS repeat-associated protein
MSFPEQVLVCRYRYDPLDRLTGHNLPDKPELQRFYCKSRLATEVEGTIGYSIVQHDDLLLAQQQRRSELVETALLATGLQRSVLQTVKAGQQRHAFAYSPYGHRPAENGLSSLLGFNGERPDPVTGHYLLGKGYRAFNPMLMRFNSPDSLSPFGRGGINAYAYCNGDPVNFSDPSGHFPNPFRKLIKHINKRISHTKINKEMDKIISKINVAHEKFLDDFNSDAIFKKDTIAEQRKLIEQRHPDGNIIKPFSDYRNSTNNSRIERAYGPGVPDPTRNTYLDLLNRDPILHTTVENITDRVYGGIPVEDRIFVNDYVEHTNRELHKIAINHHERVYPYADTLSEVKRIRKNRNT